MKKGFSFVKQCNSFGMAYNRKGPSQIMSKVPTKLNSLLNVASLNDFFPEGR